MPEPKEGVLAAQNLTAKHCEPSSGNIPGRSFSESIVSILALEKPLPSNSKPYKVPSATRLENDCHNARLAPRESAIPPIGVMNGETKAPSACRQPLRRSRTNSLHLTSCSIVKFTTGQSLSHIVLQYTQIRTSYLSRSWCREATTRTEQTCLY